LVAFCATVFWLPEDFVEELEEVLEEDLVEELEEDLEEELGEDLEGELDEELEELCVLLLREPLEPPTPLELAMGDTSSKRRADSSPILLVDCFPSLRQVAVEEGFVNLELMMRLSGGLPLLLTRPHILISHRAQARSTRRRAGRPLRLNSSSLPVRPWGPVFSSEASVSREMSSLDS
jgi:hypothetical protein